MIFLYIVKIHVNEKFKNKLPVPIPVELIVVVVGTVASYFGKFNQKYGVKIIGDLPLGFVALNKNIDIFLFHFLLVFQNRERLQSNYFQRLLAIRSQ